MPVARVMPSAAPDDCATQHRDEPPYRMQKLETVGRLAGGIAHDFNNLLTIILGYTEMALAGLAPGDPRYGDLEEVRKAGRSAAALARQLLLFSRRQVLEARVLSPNELVVNLNKMLHRLVGEDVEFVTELAPDCWNVAADSSQLEQVILNLVVNARYAMPQGGRLAMSTGNVRFEADPRSEKAVMPEGEYVRLSVADNGVGMKEDVRRRVFEPFFTTKEVGQGSGLGLSTAYGIVKRSKGYIFAHSRPGLGSTFEIYLPRAHGEPRALAHESRVRESRGTETILLVEDDPRVRLYARRVLEEAGYRVLEARDGAEGLELSDKHGDEIHVIVTDVVMPFLSGPELAQCVRNSDPRVKLLYISGYPDEAMDRHRVTRTGIPLLRKPFTPESLNLKVREVLDESSLDRP